MAKRARADGSAPWPQQVGFWAAGLGLAVLLPLPIFYRHYAYENQDWRGSAAYLGLKLKPGDRVITGPHSVNICLDYYLGRSYPGMTTAKTATFLNQESQVQTPEKLNAELKKRGRVWYVNAWADSMDPAYLAAVKKKFVLQTRFPAQTPWGEIYVYLRQ